MKKFILSYFVLFFLLISNVAHAGFFDSNAGMVTFGVVFYITAAISIVISCMTFLPGLVFILPAFAISSTYYIGKSIVVDKDKEFHEVILCDAAKDLNLNFDTNTQLTGNYLHIDDSNLSYDKISKLDPFITPLKKVNKKPNFLCVSENNSCINEMKKDSYIATGTWKPIKAFSYTNKSYIQFKHHIDSKSYVTATAELNNIFKYLDYEGYKVFKNVNQKINVKDICPILRKVSIHRLKEIKKDD